MIGSGAGGGTAVKVLTDLGVKVTLLEAGPMLNPAKDFKEHQWPYQYPHRGAGEHAESYFGRSDLGTFAAPNGWWDIEGEPYTVAEGSRFRWFRSRIIGGRTNHYGRISLRFADYDFKPYSRDGLGTDWPITYDDIAPYYDKAESFIGVCGSKEGIRSAPDGVFMPPPPPRVNEVLVQKAARKLGIPCIPARMAGHHEAAERAAGVPLVRGSAGEGASPPRTTRRARCRSLPAMKSGRLTVVAERDGARDIDRRPRHGARGVVCR